MKKMIRAALLISFIFSFSLPISATENREVQDIYMQYTVINTELSGIADVEEAINVVSVPAIGVRIHIEPVFIGNLAADTSYAIASGENLDIVNVGLTNDMSSLVAEGLLLPLDDLLEEHGQEAAAVTEGVAEAQKIGGVTYAISQYPYAANSTGFLYNLDMAEKYGLDMHDGITMKELEEIGGKLKEQGIWLTSVGLSSELAYKFFCSMEIFGESGNYGAILDPAESTEIVNVFASDGLRDFYQTIRRWYENGYIPDNQLLDESAVLSLYQSQQLFCMPTNVTAGQMGNSHNREFRVDVIITSDPMITTSGAVEFMLGIASSCKNPEAAMDFINLLYTNSEIADLLNYGIEGKDYRPVEGTENVITREGTANEDGSRFGSGFLHFGDPLKIRILDPLTDDYYQKLTDWEEAAVRSRSFGYSFDASGYAVEASNIARILEEYLPILNTGIAADVDGQLDLMNKELEKAGINEIISANNVQLQEYLNTKNAPFSVQ